MIADPAADADADRGDLGFGAIRLGQPDADPPLAPLAPEVEVREGSDHPLLEPPDVRPEVRPAALQIEHQVGDPLTRAMIGVLATPAGREHREAGRRQQVLGARAGTGGVERRVLEQPAQLRRATGADRLDPLLHDGQRVGIGNRLVADPPLHRAARPCSLEPLKPAPSFAISRAIRRWLAPPSLTCGRGGIGRRAALRALSRKRGGSSSLLDRTISPSLAFTSCPR